MLRQASAFLLVVIGGGILIGCDSTTTPAGQDSSNDLVIITITGINGDRSFAPAAATIKAGQSVAWKNNDGATHRPILSDVFDTRALASGATSASTKMTTPGTYDYKCTIHPSMTGTITVTP